MLKKVFLLSILCAARVVFAQMLDNGDFAKGLTGWAVTDWKQAKGTAKVEDGVLRLDNSDSGQTTMIQQAFTIKPQTRYKLKYRLKTDNVIGDGRKSAGATVMILYQGKHLFEASPAGAWSSTAGTTPWQNVEYLFDSGERSGVAVIYPTLRLASGTAYFGDLTLDEANRKPVDPAQAAPPTMVNLLVNGDFSQGMDKWSAVDWKQARGTAKVENAVLCIENSAMDQNTMVQQAFAIKANTEYMISYRLKLDHVTGAGKNNPGATMLILHQGKFVCDYSPEGLWRGTTGNSDWQTVEYRFNSGNREGYFTILPTLRFATGTAYFDNIVVAEFKPQTAAEKLDVKFFPVKFQRDTYSLAAGFPGVLFAEIFGSPQDAGKLVLELDLPPGVTCDGAVSYHATQTDANGVATYHADRCRATKIQRDGFPYDRVAIEISPTVISRIEADKLFWNNYERIFLTAAQNSPGGRVFYRLKTDNFISKEEKSFEIKVLPPLLHNPKPLEKFGLLIAYPASATLPLATLRDAYNDFWLKSARRPQILTTYNWTGIAPQVRKELHHKYQVAMMLGSRGLTPLGDLSGWKRRTGHDIPKMVFADGKMTDEACPSYLENPSSPFWDDFVPGLIRSRQAEDKDADTIVWDVEPGAKDFCYCAVCREKFSNSIQQPLLSAGEITNKYAKAFYQYRVAQNDRVIGNFAAALRRHFPKSKIVLSTDNLHLEPPHIAEWCGVDVRNNDSNFDMMMNMPYFEGILFYDTVKFNINTLKTPQFMLIDPSENVEMFYSRYTPGGVLMNMLACAALGSKGIGFWPFDAFDGRYLHAIRNGANLIALGEKYYTADAKGEDYPVEAQNVRRIEVDDGQQKIKVSIPDLDKYLRARIHSAGDARLITIFNYNADETAIARIALPGTKGGVRELNTNRIYRNADVENGFLVKIAPQSVLLLELGGENTGAPGEFDPAENEKILLKFYADNPMDAALSPRSCGSSSAGWGAVADSKGTRLRLAQQGRVVLIDHALYGGVVSWMTDGRDILLNNGKARGVLDELRIHNAQDVAVFAPTEFTITPSGDPSAKMSYTVLPPRNADPGAKSLAGLQITKQVTLSDGGKKLQSIYTFSNPTAVPLTFGYRLRNWPRRDGECEIRSGKLLVKGGSDNGGLLWLAPGAEGKTGGLPGKVLSGDFTPNPVEFIPAVTGDPSFCFKMTPVEWAGVMIWWSNATQASSTVELLGREMTLEPGGVRSVSSTIEIINK